MRCGFTGHSAPTIGCFMRRIRRVYTARAAMRADLYLNATERLLPRLPRKAWCGSDERPEATMKRLLAAPVLLSITTAALGASGKQSAPPGSFEGAPPQYTRFSVTELERGFLALAFGSDLRIGARPLGIRRFDQPIRARVIGGGTVDRSDAMSHVIAE